MRRSVLPATVGVLLLGVSTGCARDPNPARLTSDAFHAAVGRGDTTTACALLAPSTRDRLEQSQRQPCPDALVQVDLPARQVRDVQVFGRQALVELDGHSAFLARLSTGWRVVAAGCREQPGPYDCQVDAG